MVLRRRLIAVVALALSLVLALAVAGCASTTEPAPEPQSGTSTQSGSDGQALVEQKCTMCHPIDQVNAAIYDQAQWEATVGRMETNGLVVTPEEKQAIIDYLVERDASR